ncbi:hypothetical protein JTE90_021858 [Oedothorax gibbosus]|uniref:Carboxylesterase type B domain-containing protein n=1 Tax=Oedothorax gibbosus TaxID=931172 RepID=A0AAV6UY99_9ARAC|nr:hypothetical protein JTE90_021858 [Oedothorax gibbosus]
MVTDIRQTCPLNDFTEMLSTVTKSPVFRYVVSSRPSAPIRVYSYPGVYSSHLWDVVAFFDTMHLYIDTPKPEDFRFRDTIQKTVVEFIRSSGTGISPEEWLKYPNSIALMGQNITLVDSYHKTKCKFWSAHGLTDYAWVS